MTLDSGQSLIIPMCGLFSEDVRFINLKRYLPSGWLDKQFNINLESTGESEDSMDNVQFHNDRIEIVINVIGYAPQDIRCNVTDDKIEVIAHQSDTTTTTTDGMVKSNMCMNRTYELPRKINSTQATCFLSRDGFLGITAPWL